MNNLVLFLAENKCANKVVTCNPGLVTKLSCAYQNYCQTNQLICKIRGELITVYNMSRKLSFYDLGLLLKVALCKPCLHISNDLQYSINTDCNN